MKFEWDPSKEKKNIKKHGITFEQASYVFADPFALSNYDAEHSKNEDRWVLLGKSLNETILIVVHAAFQETFEKFARTTQIFERNNIQ